ncbi:MAG: histidine triad nucleotide-binding protein [Clostridia bacterium]|nr:histidine triad nucleotide-binding protein [Clostridia bacterium]
MADCLFCKIIKGEIPSQKVYEDDLTYAFRDVNPQTPTHVLVVPKVHVANVLQAASLGDDVLAGCLRACAKVAELEGLGEKGFRVVTNCGDDACQSVHHLHLHVMGGRQMAGEMA